jgi:hypothetical protein
MCRRLNESGEEKRRGRPKDPSKQPKKRLRPISTKEKIMALKRKTRRRKLCQVTGLLEHPTRLARSELKQAMSALKQARRSALK